MKLRATIIVEWEVANLDHYAAETIEQAAEFTQTQYNDGDIDPGDLLAWGNDIQVKIDPVKP